MEEILGLLLRKSVSNRMKLLDLQGCERAGRGASIPVSVRFD
jgi:hypothetical protein